MSREHAFIYIKAYKVGGTSVEMYLQPACQPADTPLTEQSDMIEGPDGIVGARCNFLERTPPRFYNHMTASEIREALPAEAWCHSRKAGNVRNPYARYLSGYFMHHKRADPEASRIDTVRARLADYVAGHRDPTMQDYFRLDGEMILTDPIRFEALEADAAAFAASVGFTPPAPLGHAKRRTGEAKERPVADYYTPEAIAAVQERDAWYFDAFGYSRDINEAIA